MAGFSQYLALLVFNGVLNPTPVPVIPPTGLWMALHTSEPDDTAYGGEASYAGYARAAVSSLTATVSSVPPETRVVVTNNNAVTFTPSTNPLSVTVTHWSLWDAEATGDGNMLISGTLTPARVVENGDWVILPEGRFTFTIE